MCLGPSSSDVLHGGAAGILLPTAAQLYIKEQRSLLEHFSQACNAMHRSWEVRTWDAAAVEALLQLRYPQFLEFFYQYPTIFMQGEIMFDGVAPAQKSQHATASGGAVHAAAGHCQVAIQDSGGASLRPDGDT